ncbi:MAG: hypothetical protein AAFP69_15045, partial [Planctomycetota bacterium]
MHSTIAIEPASAVVDDAHTSLIQRGASYRCGQIVAQSGRVTDIQHRWFPRSVSMLRVAWDIYFPRKESDICRLDFHQPWGMPAFLALDYIA